MKCQFYPELKIENADCAVFDALHPMFAYHTEQVPESVVAEFAEAKRFVVIGLGGSVLPLKAFVDFFGLSDRIFFLDTVDEGAWKRIKEGEAKTLFCVASKSGETLEIKAIAKPLNQATQH